MSEGRFAWLEKVVSEGSIRAAAQALNVNPSSVTRKLQSLEEQLNVRLIDRSHAGVSLTEAGRLALQFHQEERQRSAEFADSIEILRDRKSRSLRIGAGQNYVTELVQGVLSGLVKADPELRIALITGGTTDLVRMTLEGEVDFSIAYNPPDLLALHAIKSVPLPLVVVVAPDHPLATLDSVSLDLVQPYVLISSLNHFGTSQLVEHAARVEKVKFNHQLVTNSHLATLEFVKSGAGVAFTTEYAFAEEVRAGRVIALRIDNTFLNSGQLKLLVKAGRRASNLVDRTMRAVISKLTIMK